MVLKELVLKINCTFRFLTLDNVPIKFENSSTRSCESAGNKTIPTNLMFVFALILPQQQVSIAAGFTYSVTQIPQLCPFKADKLGDKLPV